MCVCTSTDLGPDQDSVKKMIGLAMGKPARDQQRQVHTDRRAGMLSKQTLLERDAPVPSAGTARGLGLVAQEVRRPHRLSPLSLGESSTSSISCPGRLVMRSSMSLPWRLPMATAVW